MTATSAEAVGSVESAPHPPHTRLILGAAHRIRGNTQAALAVLENLVREQPHSAPVCLGRGIARGQAVKAWAVAAALFEALRLKPDPPHGWRMLADQLDVIGDGIAVDDARAHYLMTDNRDSRLLEAAALVENNLPYADERSRTHLSSYPTDVAALRTLAYTAEKAFWRNTLCLS